jgi:hypothetical protein
MTWAFVSGAMHAQFKWGVCEILLHGSIPTRDKESLCDMSTVGLEVTVDGTEYVAAMTAANVLI